MTLIVRTLPDHATCRHKDYRLTCQQYEDMLRAGERRCETCNRASGDAPGGKLVIDHDGTVGDWAVRGLLCQGCNAQIRVDRPVPAWATAYLADPWYMRHLRALGLEAECPPEPGPEVVRIQDFDGRVWWRRRNGWHAGHKKTRDHTWNDLFRRFGPHNLLLLKDGDRARRSGASAVDGKTVALRIDSTPLAARALRECLSKKDRFELAALLLED